MGGFHSKVYNKSITFMNYRIDTLKDELEFTKEELNSVKKRMRLLEKEIHKISR
jgi:prefoldin subunit 5